MRSRRSLAPEPGAQLGFAWHAPGLVAGVDEAGRGPLAGPVVAAAVILDELRPVRGLADSKLLTARRREQLYEQILANALALCVAEATVDEIDRHNILQASLLAMKRAVEGLRLPPARVLVDGNQLPRLRVACESVIGGDASVPSISAASILAKVHRDRLCDRLHEQHPQYGFAVHKGYGTPAHLAALRRHGPCEAHRRSFGPVRELLGSGDHEAAPGRGSRSPQLTVATSATVTVTRVAITTMTRDDDRGAAASGPRMSPA